MVSLDGKEKVSIISVDIPKASQDEDTKRWATNDLKMTGEERAKRLEAALWAEGARARKTEVTLKHLLAKPTYKLIPSA